MISIYYPSKNALARSGIAHFIERSGIPFEYRRSSSGTDLTYGAGTREEFAITVFTNTIQPTVCGTVANGKSAPAVVCESPKDTGKGSSVLAFFQGSNGTYPCITSREGGIDVGVDVFSESGALLSGHLDRIWGSLDENVRSSVSTVPSVDFLEDLLVSCIVEGCKTLDLPLIRKAAWPNGKKFAVCLSHDVDEVKKTYQWITRPARNLVKGNMAALKRQFVSAVHKLKGKEPYWTFEEIVALEQQFQVTSTFYFLKETGRTSVFSPETWKLFGRNHSFDDPDVQRAIRFVQSHGSEVAIHGSFYSFAQEALLASEKQELEMILGQEVTGIRQHHLNLLIPKTWEYQIRAGLSHDSSLGYKDRIGFRWGTAYPFFPLDEISAEPFPLLQIPLSIMDICLLSSPFPLKDWVPLAEQAEQHLGVLTLLWHPPVFNADESPGAREIYRNIIEYSRARGAWVTHARAIWEWHLSRNRLSISLCKEGLSDVISAGPSGYPVDISITFPNKSGFRVGKGEAEVLERIPDPCYPEFDRLLVRFPPGENNRKIVVNCYDA